MSWLPDWLTGHDADNYEAGLEADRKNRALTDDLHNRGLITDADYAVANGHYDEAAAYDPGAEIDAAFMEGLDDGADNIRGGLTSTLNTVIGTPLKLIPWQVWVGAAGYVAWRLGVFDGILKRAK